MSTTSTKSRRKKQQAARKKESVAARQPSEPGPPADGAELSQRAWRFSSAAILIVGAFLRLYNLSLVPLHHDEGVNGNFLVTLVRGGSYTYNPENYHGPTLYYFSAIIPWLARFLGGKAFADKYGLTTFNIRFVTAVFGIATIGLVLLLRKRLGAIGALSAAALIAISPGAVYLSRYFIHESLFVFFTLGIVVAALKYYDSRRSVYLILATISAALLVATKETWIINGPVLLIALITTSVYFKLREKLAGQPAADQSESSEPAGGILAGFGGPVPVATVALVALTIFIIVNVLFYSSFFTNYPKGVRDAFQTLNLWRHRTHEHAHPFAQDFEWLRQMESPLLLLGAVGAAIAVWRGDNRFALFAAQWAFGLLVAYSLVTYKTPWISLNFIVPLAIMSGYALNSLYKQIGQPWAPFSLAVGAIALLVYGRLVKLKFGDAGAVSGVSWEFDFSKNWLAITAMLLLAMYIGYILYSRSDRQKNPTHFYVAAAIVLVVLSYQMYQLNFVHYDDEQYAYVYAHTRRETVAMIDEIDRIAKRLKTGDDTGIALVSPDYWPLPWYFRDYKRVGYYQHIVPTTEAVIIGSKAQEEELKTTYGDRYQLINSGVDDGAYPLRPGVDLLLYVRKDVPK
ncbi:MAG: flippase activity-associated protein Agl23 [Acidobacteriota bacterium]